MKEYRLPVTMNQDEVEYLEAYMAALPEGAKLVEWGSGGSTTMFLDNMKDGQTIISIEHNKEWHDKIVQVLADHPRRSQLTYLFIPPEVELNFWGYGVPKEENPCFLQEYLNPELAFDDVTIWDADFFLVDGIARGANLSCIRNRATAIWPDVFIHDYKGREDWYQWSVDLYPYKEQVGSLLLKLNLPR